MHYEIRQYLKYLEGLGRSAKTISAYRKRLEMFREHADLGSAADIDRAALRDYQNQLLGTALARSSRFAFLATLRTFLRWLHEEGKVLSDLSACIDLPRRKEFLSIQPLTEEEVAELIESMPPDTPIHKRYRAMLEVFYGAGLRREEISRLRIKDVDFERQTLFVRGKGGKERAAPVSDVALHYVQVYLAVRIGETEDGASLFTTTTGRASSVHDVDRLFRLLNKSFHKHVHPHLLRHCYAVHMLKGGADIRVLQEFLGHEDIDTTQQYLHLVKEDLKAAYDAAMEGVFGDESE